MIDVASSEVEHLDTVVDVPDGATEHFARDGYHRFEGLLERDIVARFASIVRRVADTSGQRTTPLEQRTVYQQAFLQEMNLWQRTDAIRPLTFSARIARVAAQLLDVEGVRIYHDQALVKEAGGGKTPWHCDQYYWPLATDRVVTAWIPLHDIPLEQGPLEFAIGSHNVDLGRHLDISDESEATIRNHASWRDLDVDRRSVTAGDVTFHLGWTFHGAHPNNTTRDRLVHTVIFFADGTRLAEPTTRAQALDRRLWLPDSQPGEPIDSWLNPLVWSRGGEHHATRTNLPPAAPMVGTFDLDPGST